jgi:glutamyl-Q tRNA(Asp) synthetase
MDQVAGRFAPSPTGPLHSGSLLAATASYLDARSRNGSWFVRIDDLDTFRNVSGAEPSILASLEAHGLKWDGPVIRQSERLDRYTTALDQLTRAGQTFYCTCSRAQLRGTPVYPGTCRGVTGSVEDAAIRLRVSDETLSYTDLIAGPVSENLALSCGDFIIRRRDGLIAYQLATAVDDGDGTITHVIRGGDLLDNTIRQRHLMTLLGLTPPRYAHLPVLIQPDGKKLSKQTHAPALDDERPGDNLRYAFDCLGLTTPADIHRWPVAQILAWGVENWSLKAVPVGERVFRY